MLRINTGDVFKVKTAGEDNTGQKLMMLLFYYNYGICKHLQTCQRSLIISKCLIKKIYHGFYVCDLKSKPIISTLQQ